MDLEIIKDELKKMRLTKMLEKYLEQCADVNSLNLSFDERFAQLVSTEYDARQNNAVAKMIHSAHFSISTANLNDVNYNPERELDKSKIESLRSNKYIEDNLNIMIVGASRCGKTWLACALGINACQSKYRVLYIRMPDLFADFEANKIQGQYQKYIQHFEKYDLLIIDDFLLTTTSIAERENLLELIERRINKKSTIFCSQWTLAGWHEKLGGGAIADAILDRIKNSSYTIEPKGNSLREEYSRLK